jgi:hypothetical protein
MKKLHLCFGMVALLFIAGCSSGDSWEGHVYPDRANLLINRASGVFQDLESCEKACMTMLTSMDSLDKGYYECGKNCRGGASYSMDCEDNIRGNYYK